VDGFYRVFEIQQDGKELELYRSSTPGEAGRPFAISKLSERFDDIRERRS